VQPPALLPRSITSRLSAADNVADDHMADTDSPAASLRHPLALPMGEVLDRLGGDRDLLALLVDIHRREAPAALNEIRMRAEANDAVSVEKAAHRLVGSLLVFGAADAAEAARAIEHLALEGRLGDVRQRLSTLDLELGRVSAALDRVPLP